MGFLYTVPSLAPAPLPAPAPALALEKSSSTSVGLIVGLAVGGAALLVLASCALLFCIKRRRGVGSQALKEQQRMDKLAAPTKDEEGERNRSCWSVCLTSSLP
jgi:hypothetical protein